MGRGGVALGVVLLGRLVAASCTWLRSGVVDIHGYNGTMVATVMEEDEGEVFGPPTPPLLDFELVAHMVGDLWEDGQEWTVELMCEYVHRARQQHEGRHTGLDALWEILGPYRARMPPTGELPPIWLAWIEEKIRFALEGYPDTAQGTQAEEGEHVVLMQRAGHGLRSRGQKDGQMAGHREHHQTPGAGT